ncbi:MAG: VCBS repeat-containing protein [Candidatus Brocadiae bacterium]|nr:VCBS repeat-containing protein [Candidatus Brocadiia bacterium]
MSRAAWIGAGILVVVVLVGGGIIAVRTRASGPASEPAGAPAAGGETDRSGVPAVAGPALPVILRLPEFVLENERGESVGLHDLAGQIWVASFIFTRCAGTCPLISAEVSRLAGEVASWPEATKFRFVSFSVDPDHDRPGVLEPYARAQGADAGVWTFLTGTRQAVHRLVTGGFRLPVSEQADPAMPILHSQSLVLVDAGGRVRGVFDALSGEGQAGLRSALASLAAEGPPGRIDAPPDLADTDWLRLRQGAQLAGAAVIDVPCGFRYADRVGASGITFVHGASQDTGRTYRPNHYDHGTGLAVADIDGDGLTDVFFVNQVGPCGLFRNLGGGRFEDVGQDSPVLLQDRACVGAAFADYDNDGDPDLFVTSVRAGNALFANDGRGRFSDVTEAAGLGGVTGHGAGAVFFDYDSDGFLDLFVTQTGVFTEPVKRGDGRFIALKDAFAGHLHPHRREQSLLYRNTGKGTFTDVSGPSGLVHAAWSGDATPFDCNDDGRVDLYVLCMQGYDDLWENAGEGKFRSRGREMFPQAPFGSMGLKVLDWNGDGRLDLYIVDMHTDMMVPLMPDREKWKLRPEDRSPLELLGTDGKHVLGNALFVNRGGGVFEESSDAANVETGWPWGVSSGDLNADGWPDLFVTGAMNYPFRYSTNSVLLNVKGVRFADAEFIVGVEPRKRLSLPWFRLDADGEDKGHPLCKGRQGELTVWGARGSRSSAIFDLDGDGDLDIITNEYGDVPQVLVSDLSAREVVRSLVVRLRGTRSNRDGLGAVVSVSAGGRTQVQLHDGKSGYFGQSSQPLYFGIGAAEAAETITVRWPTGTVQTVPGPHRSGSTVRIEEAP